MNVRRFTYIAIVGALVVLTASSLSAAKRPWLGIYMQDVSKDLAEAFDLKTTTGVLVNDVADDSPAEEAGIKAKDIILSWNGNTVEDSDALTALVRDSKIGDKANLEINRDGKEMSLTVEIGERREPQLYGFGQGDADDYGTPPADRFHEMFKTVGIGVSLQTLSGDLGEYFGVPDGKGALITEVMDDTPAKEAGLKVGDVIVAINEEKVETPSDLTSEVRSKDRGEEVELTIVRNKSEQKVSLKVDEIETYGSMNVPGIPNNFNWNDFFGGQGERFHNWSAPQVDQEDFMRKMEQMEKRLEEMRAKLETLEKKMK